MSRQYRERMIDSLDRCTEENEIPGYPGYHATEDGDIIHVDPTTEIDEHTTAHYIKEHKGDRHGHLNVRIKGNRGTAKEPYIHRLVADVYIPNPNDLPVVRHLDNDPTNNSVDNLARGTQKDNIRDCIRNGHFRYITDKEREKGLAKVRRPVWAEKDGERQEYKSIAEAKRAPGAVNAAKVLSGEREQACGYKFGYLKKK